MSNFKWAEVNDEDKSLQSSGGGKFGLNQKVFFSELSFNATAGRDNTEGNAVDVNIMIGDKEYRRRLFEVHEEPEFGNFEDNSKMVGSTILHVIKATGVNPNTVAQTLAAIPDDATFSQFAQALLALVPRNYKETPIDVFLEYQWEIKDGQDRTYLILPANMKGGPWICPHIPGDFKEVRSEDELVYVNSKGVKHKFERNATFLNSNKAKQQTRKDESNRIESLSGEKSVW